MKEKLVIVGTGETADIAFEYFTYDGTYDIVAFSVNRHYLSDKTYHDMPLVALEELSDIFHPDTHKIFVAMSSGALNRNREGVYHFVKQLGYQCVSYVSPNAFVWKTAKIGENCFIFENNIIQHGVEIGDNVVLWSGNHIGHQTKIKDHAFLSSHCVISGYCEVGENSFLGVNCALADHVTIGRDCFVGMGAAVSRNLPENTLIKAPKSEVSKLTAKKFCSVE